MSGHWLYVNWYLLIDVACSVTNALEQNIKEDRSMETILFSRKHMFLKVQLETTTDSVVSWQEKNSLCFHWLKNFLGIFQEVFCFSVKCLWKVKEDMEKIHGKLLIILHCGLWKWKTWNAWDACFCPVYYIRICWKLSQDDMLQNVSLWFNTKTCFNHSLLFFMLSCYG